MEIEEGEDEDEENHLQIKNLRIVVVKNKSNKITATNKMHL